jgi:hypothetical protein
MRRRALLALAATLAGCTAPTTDPPARESTPGAGATGGPDGTVELGDGTTPDVSSVTDGPSMPTPTETDRPDLPPSGYGRVGEFDPGETVAARTVGAVDDDTHHRIVVWNDSRNPRRVAVTLRDVAADRTVIDESFRLPADGAVAVAVGRRAPYVLRVVPAGTDGRRLGVPESFVDCNASTTSVAVRWNGTVEAGVGSTLVACNVTVGR